MTILVRAIEATRRYGDVLALDRVSLDIKAGELVGLLGPNGAGKSTLINLFVGLRRPTSGTVELFGGSPLDPALRRGIGVTPRRPGCRSRCVSARSSTSSPRTSPSATVRRSCWPGSA